MEAFSLLGIEFQNSFVLEVRDAQCSLGFMRSLSKEKLLLLFTLNLLLLSLLFIMIAIRTGSDESTSQVSFDELEISVRSEIRP